MLSIDSSVSDNTLILRLEGRIDTDSVAEFGKSLDCSNVGAVVLDMSKTLFVSSGGLREILKAQKALDLKNGTITIMGASNEIRETLDMVNFTEFVILK